jgi:hypothetical protein
VGPIDERQENEQAAHAALPALLNAAGLRVQLDGPKPVQRRGSQPNDTKGYAMKNETTYTINVSRTTARLLRAFETALRREPALKDQLDEVAHIGRRRVIVTPKQFKLLASLAARIESIALMTRDIEYARDARKVSDSVQLWYAQIREQQRAERNARAQAFWFA